MAPTEDGCHQSPRRHGRGHRPRSSAEPGLWHSAARSDASAGCVCSLCRASSAAPGLRRLLRAPCSPAKPFVWPFFPPCLGRGARRRALRGGLGPQSPLHISLTYEHPSSPWNGTGWGITIAGGRIWGKNPLPFPTSSSMEKTPNKTNKPCASPAVPAAWDRNPYLCAQQARQRAAKAETIPLNLSA